MTLRVSTARLGYRGEDWLDVSLQGNMRRCEAGEIGGHRGVGIAFAPSPELLYPYLSKRRFNRLKPEDWPRYADAYTAEMRASYRRARAAWDLVLTWERVVLLCFCVEKDQCHRRVLAGILGKLGARRRGRARVSTDDLHALFRERDRIERWANTLWRRFARGAFRATDGFQIGVVRAQSTGELRMQAQIYGGASFAGDARAVQRACREHVRRVARRGRRASESGVQGSDPAAQRAESAGTAPLPGVRPW